MSRPALIAAMTAMALLLFVTIDPDDAPLLALATLLLAAAALALAYDPAIDPLLRARRRPGWRDAKLLLLCTALAFMALAAAELFLPLHWRLAWGGSRSLADGIAWSLQLIVLAGPPTILIAIAMVPKHAPGTRPPLWPLGAGLIGSLLAWPGGGLPWLGMIRPLLEGRSSRVEAALSGPGWLRMGALALGITAQFWWRAWHDRGAPRFDATGMFRTVIVGAAVATGLGLAVATAYTLSPLGVSNKAEWLACLQIMLLAAAWIAALRQISRMAPGGRYRPIGVIALLWTVMPMSYALPVALANAREWAELVALVTTPLVIGTGALVFFVLPSIAAGLLNPPPSAPAGSAGPA